MRFLLLAFACCLLTASIGSSQDYWFGGSCANGRCSPSFGYSPYQAWPQYAYPASGCVGGACNPYGGFGAFSSPYQAWPSYQPSSYYQPSPFSPRWGGYRYSSY